MQHTDRDLQTCGICGARRYEHEEEGGVQPHKFVQEQDGVNYEVLAEGVDQMRETCRALVAGLMADGFLEVEARCITAGFFGINIPKAPETDD